MTGLCGPDHASGIFLRIELITAGRYAIAVIGCGQPPAIAACTRREHSTAAYMEGFILPSARSWNNKDDNPLIRPARSVDGFPKEI
jgi:hypothetical protein